MSKDFFEHKGYRGSILPSTEDGCLYGKILNIQSVVTYEAETVPALLAAFQEAVDDYLETCLELGKEPERPYKGSFNVRVDPETHRKADFSAREQGVSLNAWVEQAIETKLQTVTMSFVGDPGAVVGNAQMVGGSVFVSGTHHGTGEKISAQISLNNLQMNVSEPVVTAFDFPVQRPSLRVVK